MLVKTLGGELVHGHRAAQDPGPLVGDVQQVEQTLDGAVFAVRPVQDDQRGVDAGGVGHEPGQIALGVVAQNGVFIRVQGLEDLGPAVQRDLALRGCAAGQQGDREFLRQLGSHYFLRFPASSRDTTLEV